MSEQIPKYIKNNSQETKTYEGKDIFPGDYFNIPPEKQSRFSSNQDLITDIGNSVIIVSKTGTLEGDITDISEAVGYLKGIRPERPKDIDGTPLSRVQISRKGWFYQIQGIYFRTAKLGSLRFDNTSSRHTPLASVKYYNSLGIELTTSIAINASTVKTVIDWEMPNSDIELIGGTLHQDKNNWLSVPLGQEAYVTVHALPEVPESMGGNIGFVEGAVNLSALDGRLDIDGKTPKYLPAGYNKIRVTVDHSAGLQLGLMVLYKIFVPS